MADKQASWQAANVVARSVVALNTVRVELRYDTPQVVRPGAHLDVRLTIAGHMEERSYSIVDVSEDGRVVALSVCASPLSRGGAAVMHALQPGDEITVTNPLHDFPMRIGAKSYVLVAGGIGITAILGMAATLKRLGTDYTLYYLGNAAPRMAYLDDLRVEHGDRLIEHVTEQQGRLSVATLLETVPKDAELYMCGPIRLMEEIRRLWERSDRDPTNLRYETFGNSGWFAAESFEVSVPQYGVTTTVGPNETLLEALETAGVEIMSDCRRGECGLCEARVLQLDGEIDHRDVFYSERQKAPNEKMCCCVSRVAQLTAQSTHESGTPGRVTIELS